MKESLFEKFGQSEEALKIKSQYPEGTVIRINHLAGEDDAYNGKTGNVKYVDDCGHIHGTWGGLSIIPGEDDFDVIG